MEFTRQPTKVRNPWPFRRTVFALLIAALAAQAGSAPRAPQEAGGSSHIVSPSAVIIPLALERNLGLSSARVSSEPVTGGWALLLAGLAGGWAIGRRRMSATGSRRRGTYRLRRR